MAKKAHSYSNLQRLPIRKTVSIFFTFELTTSKKEEERRGWVPKRSAHYKMQIAVLLLLILPLRLRQTQGQGVRLDEAGGRAREGPPFTPTATTHKDAQ